VAAIRRFLLRLASLFRSDHAEADLAREIDAHLQLIEDRFLAQGLSPVEARLAARRAFGGVEQAKEHQRDARSFRVLGDSWLDFKLGARMLIKYPGLTLVGGLGVAVAIAIAASGKSVVDTILEPELPLPEGDRVVAIQNWDAARNTRERRLLHDFVAWRGSLVTVRDLGAFRTSARNLIAPGAPPETVRVAETTASAFRVARVPPLLGRHLLASDDLAGSTPVLVIGHDVWRNRFAGDPGILGRSVQLGETAYTIVGVMPEGFAFPVNHRFWVPMRAEPARYERSGGPDLFVFGRLAPDATLGEAQAELTALGQRAAAEFPKTHAQLRPQVLPYTRVFLDMDEPENVLTLRVAQLLVVMLLVLVSVNVAILVYARTATRHGEIAIRTALGASRRRIVGQLFLEALVLSGAAAAVGLALAAIVLGQLDAGLLQVVGQFPFWLRFGLSYGTAGYTLVLTFLAAAIVGVVPALKATGRHVRSRLQGLSLGGGASMQLGKTWTVLIVTQVAFAIALLPAAVYQAWESLRIGFADPGPAAKQFLTARLEWGAAEAAEADGERELLPRNRERQAEVLRRLAAEPGVAEATFARHVPGEEPTLRVEAEGVATPRRSEAESSALAVRSGRFGHEARLNRVGAGFFEAFAVPVLAGRVFGPGDTGAAASAVVVNRSFVRKILGDGEALGRRIRHVGLSGDARQPMDRWYEIVGVVADFPAETSDAGRADAKLYHAAKPGEIHPLTLLLRLHGESATGFAGRLREIAAAVDPNLQLREVATMDEVLRKGQRLLRLLAAGLGVLTLSVVLLSAAGVYALMSFTVTQRRKEIGIRLALGAEPRRILAGIFSRALGQLSVGAAFGMIAAAWLDQATHDDLTMRGHAAVVLPIVAVFTMAVGLLASLGPARRSLSIDPTEALRAE
jgi:predicted permease